MRALPRGPRDRRGEIAVVLERRLDVVGGVAFVFDRTGELIAAGPLRKFTIVRAHIGDGSGAGVPVETPLLDTDG